MTQILWHLTHVSLAGGGDSGTAFMYSKFSPEEMEQVSYYADSLVAYVDAQLVYLAQGAQMSAQMRPKIIIPDKLKGKLAKRAGEDAKKHSISASVASTPGASFADSPAKLFDKAEEMVATEKPEECRQAILSCNQLIAYYLAKEHLPGSKQQHRSLRSSYGLLGRAQLAIGLLDEAMASFKAAQARNEAFQKQGGESNPCCIKDIEKCQQVIDKRSSAKKDIKLAGKTKQDAKADSLALTAETIESLSAKADTLMKEKHYLQVIPLYNELLTRYLAKETSSGKKQDVNLRYVYCHLGEAQFKARLLDQAMENFKAALERDEAIEKEDGKSNPRCKSNIGICANALVKAGRKVESDSVENAESENLRSFN